MQLAEVDVSYVIENDRAHTGINALVPHHIERCNKCSKTGMHSIKLNTNSQNNSTFEEFLIVSFKPSLTICKS